MLKENNTEKPLLSFIITCRNTARQKLQECIDSVIHLSLRKEEVEIIVVDDGSEEITLNGILPVANDIIYVRTARHGIGATRNMGMRIASGKYIQFIKGEDKLLSEAYEHCIDIARYNDPDIVMFNSSNKGIARNDYKGEEPIDGSEYIRENDIQSYPWGYLFRRNILIDLNFSNEAYAEDEEFTTLLFLRAERVYSTSAMAYFERNKRKLAIDRHDKKLVIKRLDNIESVLLRLNDFSAALPIEDRAAMRRRLGQLTMNYLIHIVRWTRSAKQLDARVKTLEEHGLFPLPDKRYSKKYLIFNKISRSNFVRKLLGIILK